jgi:hypothetical protein
MLAQPKYLEPLADRLEHDLLELVLGVPAELARVRVVAMGHGEGVR